MATLYAKKGNLTTFTVAASNASDADKSIADYVCDNTADNVEIQAALDLVKTAGGTVLLSAGTFTLAAALVMDGAGGADTVTMSLRGQGVRTTILSMANNIHGISLTDDPKVIIEDIEIQVQGTGSGIVSTADATTYRGFWNSFFRNIFVYCPGATHTGYAMNLEGPFRSTFINIEGNGLGNGIRLAATNSAFNPGNCLFERCFMDLSKSNGIGYTLWTPDGGGQFNICTFIQCEAIDTNGSSTTSKGWYFRGSSTTYHTTKNIYVLSSNVESFNTAFHFEHSIGNMIHANYVDVKTGGTMFLFSSDSNNNDVSVLSGYVTTGNTTVLVNDANTDATKPNTIRRYEAYIETTGTLNATVTAATQFDRVSPSGPGTIDTTDIPVGKTTFAEDVKVPDEVYGVGWNGSLEVPTKNAVYDKIEAIPALTDGDKGDITVSSSGTVWTIDALAVTNGKLAGSIAASKLVGSDIATVGTITTGTWNATTIAVTNGGTGRITGTTAYSLIATGTTATGANQTLANGATTEILVGGGAAALPVWTTATGTGSPVRATSPTLVTPILGTPTSGTLTNATGLPIAGLVASTTTALGVGSVELGHATDTTLTRVSAGVVAIEGVNISTVSSTATLTNKRIQPRTASSTTAASITPDLSSANVYFRTTQTATLTIDAPIGTPVIGETIVIYVDSVAAQTLTINATYKVFGAAFPATTTAGKTFQLSAMFNGTDWKTLWANLV